LIPESSVLIFARSADFIVNEIDTSGNVVRLTNFEIPQVAVKAVESSEAPAAEDRETAVCLNSTFFYLVY